MKLHISCSPVSCIYLKLSFDVVSLGLAAEDFLAYRDIFRTLLVNGINASVTSSVFVLT